MVRLRLAFALLLAFPASFALALEGTGAAPSHAVAVGPGQPGPVAPITFSRQVVRILQAHCQSCHRDGGIAPFPLVTYRDAFDHRSAIAFMAAHRLMPPWHVSATCAAYKDDPSLTEADIGTLAAWNDAGAREGDPTWMPKPATFPDGWQLGTPDLTLSMAEAFTPPFDGKDLYRCFVLPTNENEDRYVASSEVLPGSRAMIHHVILFLDTTGAAEQLDAADPAPGYACFGGPGFTPSFDAAALGAWVPGNRPPMMPDGVGMKLPKGARVVMQIHYSVRSGVVEPDLTRVGIRFASPPVHKALRFLPLVNQTFRIPAGDPSYEVKAGIPGLPVGVHVLNVTPHMHLLGRTMRVEAKLPDGATPCLVDVPDWDFHWQATYSYREPLALPTGSALALTATYDNSADNPENPNDPPKDVTWGESTTDEMCLAFLGITLDFEELSP